MPCTSGVLPVDLQEAHERHDAQEVDDRQQHEGEGDEAVADFSRLRYKCESHDGAREGGDEDGRPAQRLGIGEPAMREQAPVLSHQDLERVWADALASEPGGGTCVGGTRLPGQTRASSAEPTSRQGRGLLSEQYRAVSVSLELATDRTSENRRARLSDLEAATPSRLMTISRHGSVGTRQRRRWTDPCGDFDVRGGRRADRERP